MSFPRAKIQRFNEITPCTPSPADYNVALKNKSVGAVIPQSERFVVPQSPAVSENGSQVSFCSTPNKSGIASKKNKPQSAQKSHPNLKDSFTNSEQHHLEHLREKIVEITNKDLFIKELTENLDELKLTICELNQQLNFEKQAYEEKLEVVNENYEVTLNDLNQKHAKELLNIKGRLSEVEGELNAVKSDYKELKCSNKTVLEEFKANIETYESTFDKCCVEFKEELQKKEGKISEKEKEVEILMQKGKELEVKHFELVEDLVKKHALEVQEIEYEMLKTVTQLQDEIEKEKRECAAKIKHIETEKQEIEEIARKQEEEKQILQSQYETKIKQMEENFNEANILAEIQGKQRIEDVEICYKIKLEAQEKEAEQILKECQAISEYNIIQCEVEKNHAKTELKEKEEECELLNKEKNFISEQLVELQSKLSDLLEKFEKVTEELEETQEKLQKELEKNKEKTVCDERTYEITIKQLHVTIEALKNRLLNSDRDVEQLKSELDASEQSKLATEDKCNKLQEEVQQLQNLNEELEIQNESTLKLTEEKIRTIENVLQGKVDDFKASVEAKTKKLEEELKDKDEKLVEAMQQLQQQQKLSDECQVLIKNARLELERLETVKIDSEYKNTRLQNALERTEKQVEALTVSEKNTKEQLLQSEDALKKQTVENDKLKLEIERLKGVFGNEMEVHQKQINQLQKKSEEDVKLKDFYKNKLSDTEKEIEEFSMLRKAYIEQSGRYDELLHKYEVLEARNVELEAKVKEQETLIGPFREQLQAYEMEHNALLSEKQDAENEAREMGLKYAAILGHQNQKQKIKYLVELQTKKFELIENKKELESKLRAQSRTIDKLKREISSFKTKKPKSSDKENVNSPNRTLNLNQNNESPAPLKERN